MKRLGMDPVMMTVGALGIGLVVWLRPKRVSVRPDQALVRSRTSGGVEVFFSSTTCFPALDIWQHLDLSIIPLSLDLKKVACQDNIKVDTTVTFSLKIPKDPVAVLFIAESVGCERATQRETLLHLFKATFSSAIRTALKQRDSDQLDAQREVLSSEIMSILGKELSGFQLENVDIEQIEPIPIEQYDPDNIDDAQAIALITTITAAQRVATTRVQQWAEQEVTKTRIETREKELEETRQREIQALEEERQREIQTAKEAQQREIQALEAAQAEAMARYEHALKEAGEKQDK
jgi:uncharacterized membrane protein YqiK